MPKNDPDIGRLLADIVEIAFRPASKSATWTVERRRAEQMITLLNAGNRAAAEKLAETWTPAERRAVQAELDRL